MSWTTRARPPLLALLCSATGAGLLHLEDWVDGAAHGPVFACWITRAHLLLLALLCRHRVRVKLAAVDYGCLSVRPGFPGVEVLPCAQGEQSGAAAAGAWGWAVWHMRRPSRKRFAGKGSRGSGEAGMRNLRKLAGALSPPARSQGTSSSSTSTAPWAAGW